MPKVIHLISDLHLCESKPHLLELFEHYMQHIATNSQQLIVLGDLFEVWVGDDNISDFNQRVIDLFKHYSQHHGKLMFAHGNRDFLLGEDFANECQGTLIKEPFNFKWENQSICLMHGDSLCTDDVAYQNFRTMVRNSHWQKEFLGLSVAKRLEVATGIKAQSKDAQQQKEAQIMDVNSETVKQCFIDNQCQWLIHGHTHREGTEWVSLSKAESDVAEGNETRAGTRIVLSDWGQKGHYLELKDNHYRSCYFECG